METKEIFQSILERFSTAMRKDPVIGEELSEEIINLLKKEDKVRKETLEKILKSGKKGNENY